MIDNEEETVKEAKRKFGWLFEAYVYKKDIGSAILTTVEGFEEVPELKKLKESYNNQQSTK